MPKSRSLQYYYWGESPKLGVEITSRFSVRGFRVGFLVFELKDERESNEILPLR